MPRHIWQGQDAETFANFDPARGWPVVSGPYTLARSEPQQRIWDLRPGWWAAKTGFRDLPKVERLIYLPYMEETKRVQNLLRDGMDTSLDLRPPNISTAVEQNPRLSTWTGRKPPFGYLDFWPISLGFNNLEAPFSDPRVRRAIAYAIDRDELVEIGWLGSGSPTLLPFPDFPPMRRFTAGVRDLVQQYEVGVFDAGKSAAIMEGLGWSRDSDGYWVQNGERLRLVIDIAPIFQDLTPVLVRQLERAGFEADFRMTSDFFTRQTQGTAAAFLTGHGGSVRDPHFTLSFYHSRFVRPTGESAERFWRWSNPTYDALVDSMGEVSPDDPRLQDLFHRAMEIWLAELPSIPLVQWYHRIPHNQTYWKNWPSAENPYIHSAYWHRTWLLVLLGLEPVQ